MSTAGPTDTTALNRFRNPGDAALATADANSLSDSGFDTTDIDAMLQRLEELRVRHRELDTTIEQLEAEGSADIQIMGLKREKLRVKDRIVWLSSRITPDIIA